MEEKKLKTPWDDVSLIWKKIAGVIAAVGVLATFTVKVFNTPVELTYITFALLGLVLLIISWYVDLSAKYIHKNVIEYEDKAIKELTDLMYYGKDETYKLKEDSDKKINTINENIDKLLEISEETRKDTLRIQLMMLIKNDENNVDTILKVAEKYFVVLHGDWFMTSEFNKWAKKHDVVIPANIYSSLDSHIDD